MGITNGGQTLVWSMTNAPSDCQGHLVHNCHVLKDIHLPVTCTEAELSIRTILEGGKTGRQICTWNIQVKANNKGNGQLYYCSDVTLLIQAARVNIADGHRSVRTLCRLLLLLLSWASAGNKAVFLESCHEIWSLAASPNQCCSKQQINDNHPW